MAAVGRWQRENAKKKKWRDEDYKFWGLSWALVPIPRLGTKACRDFYMTWAQINNFMAFVIRMAAHIEKASEIARKALDSFDVEKKISTSKDEKRIGPIEELAMQRQVFCEILLCRHIDNYLTYLSGLLFEAFLQRPELMKSSDKIEIETLLEQESIQGIIRTIAERKIEGLSYSSFGNLMDYFSDRFGIEIIDKEDVQMMIKAIETRNISVHNRCIINKRYIIRTKSEMSMLGKKEIVDISSVEPVAMMLGEAVKQIDCKARKKLKLKGARFIIHPYADSPKYKKLFGDESGKKGK